MRQTLQMMAVFAFLYGVAPAYAGPERLIAPIPADVPPEVQAQIEALHAPSTRKKIMAIRRLGEMGPDAGAAAPYLIELLDSKEKYVTFLERIYNIIAILGSSGSHVMQETKTALVRIGPPAVGPLINALNHPRPKVRGNAALALGKIRDPRAIGPLIGSLKDQEPEVRMWAAVGLGEMPSEQSVWPLVNMLLDTDKNVRSYAAFSLGKIGDRRAIDPLIQSLRKGNDSAGPALHEITGESFGSDAAKWQRWWNSNKGGRTR